MIFSDRTTIAELKTSIFFPNEYATYSLTANFNNTFDISPKIFSHMCQLCLIESRGGGRKRAYEANGCLCINGQSLTKL